MDDYSEYRINKGLTPTIIVIDNFYENPFEIREFALNLKYEIKDYYPGKRSESYANERHKTIFDKILEPYGEKINAFCSNDNKDTDNGTFQYTVSNDRSWIHSDNDLTNWAGIIYLTPNAPETSGTCFYKFKDGTMNSDESRFLKTDDERQLYCRDMTKWSKVDIVGNVFNRLVLFDSRRFHASMDYFGDNIKNGRLFQVFFFSTEVIP
jgi:hypothetical protein